MDTTSTLADGLALARFLLERFAEDEAIANDALHPDAVEPGVWITEHHDSEYHDLPNRAHIAEDRHGRYWSVAHEVFIPIAEHMARHDPARVLVECGAKRAIVERYVEVRDHFDGTVALYSGPESPSWGGGMEPELQERLDTVEELLGELEIVLGHLAEPYASHPDCRPEWVE